MCSSIGRGKRCQPKNFAKKPMMALMDSLEAGRDAVGHYRGRLIFVMVGRHFLPAGEVLEWLKKGRLRRGKGGARSGGAGGGPRLQSAEARAYSPSGCGSRVSFIIQGRCAKVIIYDNVPFTDHNRL